jgi:predicted dehydrogenase/threonine dehydrogenase-like Zn-dependent dehydrogenase
MRQILQSLNDGSTVLAEVPAPRAGRGTVLVRTTRSLISAGTERMLVDFGRAGWLDKARQQPEKVWQVLEKAQTDGVLPTLEAVRSKLDQPLALGYCNVGTVVEVGSDVRGLSPGDRVVSNGPHAEFVSVSRNLCARVPDEVSDEAAAFTVLGAIALQGLRLSAPTLGERFVVTGLGLIGLLTVQLLRASGCRVLGVDPDPTKCELAQRLGADVVRLHLGEDPQRAAGEFSEGKGVDGVIITASTRSNEPVSQAAKMCRQRGRIVLVGVAGLELNRADFYQKELTFQVSCSYGPGRYDVEYEEKGHDYPFGFVRWTEQRNFEAVLEMMAAGKLDVRSLVTNRFGFSDAAAAYELLSSGKTPYLGILLEYDADAVPSATRQTIPLSSTAARTITGTAPRFGFVGAGNYAGRTLIPAFAAAGAQFQMIASSGGITAAHFGRKFGFTHATTETEAVMRATDVDAVVIATRHDTHARLICDALDAQKHVFVEKPLAITHDQVDQIVAAWERCNATGRAPHVMVGFNRRFAPHIVQIKKLLAGVREPKSFIVTVNAGAIPASHWTQDPQVGGGRIVGEACHFIDLLRFLAGHEIVASTAQPLGRGAGPVRDDVAVITLAFADGSWGTIHYLANGHSGFPKERVEVFCAGRILQLDNFRKLRGVGWQGFKSSRLWRQDKGQRGCAAAFTHAIASGADAPIPFAQLVEVARVTIELSEAARL